MTTLASTGNVAAHTIPAQTGKRTMIVSLATIALIIGVTSGFAYSQVDRAELTQVSDLRGEAWDQMTAPASSKVRCIMPPTWRRDCPADNR
jgi:hypothetical protein